MSADYYCQYIIHLLNVIADINLTIFIILVTICHHIIYKHCDTLLYDNQDISPIVGTIVCLISEDYYPQ